MSSKRAVNNKTNERRSPRSTMLLFRSTPRAKQVERDNAHDARTAADTARSSCPWIRARRQLLHFAPKRGQQVHEAPEFLLCESLAKHGERCRIWEAERCSTSGHIALGVDDIQATCAGIAGQGGRVVREPGPMKHGSTVIAFVEDPDGYKIELIELSSRSTSA